MKNFNLPLCILCVIIVHVLGCRKKIPTQPDDDISYDYPLNLSNDSLNSYRPHIAVDSRGRVYVIWMDAQGLRLRIRDENGIWGDTKFLTDSVFGYGMASDPYDNIHIIWEKTGSDESGLARDRLFYREIYSNGEWGDIVELSDTPDVDQPVIGVDSSGGVHVLWMSHRGWLYKYKPYGGDWKWMDTLSCRANPYLYVKPDGSLIMVFSPTYTISYYEHPFGGRWSSEEIVDTSGLDMNSSWGTAFYSPSDNLTYVLWTEGNHYIDWRSKTTTGEWSPIVQLDTVTRSPARKILMEYSDRKFLVWGDYFNGVNIGEFTRDMRKFTKTEHISGEFASYISAILDKEGIIHIVWAEQKEDNFEIYYTFIKIDDF